MLQDGQYLKVREAARYLGVSHMALYKRIREGRPSRST